MSCSHVWVGQKNGVTCKLCGEHLTASEYRKLSMPKKADEKPAVKSRGKKAADD